MGIIGQCAICFSPLPNCNAVIAGKCGHVFHQNCLTQWFKQSKSCPSCRKKTSDRDVVRLFIDEVRLDDSLCSQSMASQVNSHKIEELTEKLSAETSKRTEAQEEVTKLKAANMSLNNKIRRLNTDIANASTLEMRIRHLEQCLENERVLKQEMAALKSKLKTCEFYNLLKCEEKGDTILEAFITADGNPDTNQFLKVLRTQLKKANEKINAHSALRQKLNHELEAQRKKTQRYQKLSVDQEDKIKSLQSLLAEKDHSLLLSTPDHSFSALREYNNEPRRPKPSLGFDSTPASRPEKRALLESASRNRDRFSYEEQSASDFEEPVVKRARNAPVEFSFECDEELPTTSVMPPVKPVTALARVTSTFGTSTFDKRPSFQLKSRSNRNAINRIRSNPQSELNSRRPEAVSAALDDSVICLN